MNLGMTDRVKPLVEKVRAMVEGEIAPLDAEFHSEIGKTGNRFEHTPRMTEILDGLKAKAKERGLWNFWLTDSSRGLGLTTVEYAYLAEEMGKVRIAAEVFNCNAPDTGNMEVLYHYGSDEQKEQWMKPLLAGEIRSAFCMTEPEVASSDATNMQATAKLEGDEVVLNGRKWWSTGIGHPDCKVLIFMGLTDPEAHRHSQHSMVLVPRDTPGVKVVRMLPTMGRYDEPIGHGEIEFDNVRLPKSAFIAGPGRGFEIAQGRLGPGRVHHCMRLIGLAELALQLACERSATRVAFGKPLMNLGGNRERIARARMQIEQARLLVLKTAWMIEKKSVFAAMSEIAQIKVVCPNMAQEVIDMAMQIHGGGGLSDDFPLSAAWTMARALRLADGPDEVHAGLVARFELGKYKSASRS